VVREILALRERGTRPCGYVREVLRREVAGIAQRIGEVARLRDELLEVEGLLKSWTGSSPWRPAR
jgi:hypothetical protein